jgi:hypothetical protein
MTALTAMTHRRQSYASRAYDSKVTTAFAGGSFSLFVYLLAFCGMLAAFAGGLSYELHPTVFVNPGLSAYRAPPATELIPRSLPPAADADQAYASAAPADAPSLASAGTQDAKPASKPSKPRKPQRTAARPRDDRHLTVLGYAPQTNYDRPWF